MSTGWSPRRPTIPRRSTVSRVYQGRDCEREPARRRSEERACAFAQRAEVPTRGSVPAGGRIPSPADCRCRPLPRRAPSIPSRRRQVHSPDGTNGVVGSGSRSAERKSGPPWEAGNSLTAVAPSCIAVYVSVGVMAPAMTGMPSRTDSATLGATAGVTRKLLPAARASARRTRTTPCRHPPAPDPTSLAPLCR